MGNIVVTLIILSLFLLFVFTFIRKVHEQKNYQRKLLEQLAHKEALRKKRAILLQPEPGSGVDKSTATTSKKNR